MAMTMVEIGRIKRELTEQVGSITRNHSLTTAQKSVQLDQVEAKMAEMRTHEANSRRFSNIMHGTGDIWQPRTKAMGMPSSAPAIMPDPEQTEALFNAVRTKQSLRVEVQTKTTNAIGGITPPVLLPGLLERTHEPQRIMDALPATGMSAPAVAYLRHNSTTGSPTTVAPGGLKPELSFVVDTVTIRAAKIAAHVAVNDEDLSDYSDFSDYVATELMRAIIDTENGQLLNGAGVGTDLSGMLNTTGALTRALGTDTRWMLSSSRSTTSASGRRSRSRTCWSCTPPRARSCAARRTPRTATSSIPTPPWMRLTPCSASPWSSPRHARSGRCWPPMPARPPWSTSGKDFRSRRPRTTPTTSPTTSPGLGARNAWRWPPRARPRCAS